MNIIIGSVLERSMVLNEGLGFPCGCHFNFQGEVSKTSSKYADIRYQVCKEHSLTALASVYRLMDSIREDNRKMKNENQ